MSGIPDAVPRRPWRPEHGPEPTVRCWHGAGRPALLVRSAGKWRYAPVHARQDYANGSVAYQVTVDLLGDTTATHQLYTWPQPGLRVAHGPRDIDADRQRWGTDITGQPKAPRRR
ncbi:hypothetical protein ACF1D2_29945 [Streptomyces bacillaris]|uniref:hypothetical protein n=1 Tax=Streptomyces bacillaris TaxID=68179 RepID=UPI0036F7B9BA